MAPTLDFFSLWTKSGGPTAKVYRNVLQQIGCVTSGRKDELELRLSKLVTSSFLPKHSSLPETARILSIDMGIKNLAYCVADVKQSSSGAKAATMEILAWRRLDLTEETWKSNFSGKTKESLGRVEEGEETEEDPFAPNNLSQTAHYLVGGLLKYEPDVILIERQRWRSSGSSAIQQWTVRVNSLEAMLWAMFTAFRQTQGSGNHAHTVKRMLSMDPRRVGTFWLDGMDTQSPPKLTKKRTKKSPVEVKVGIEEDDDINSEPTKKLSRGKAEKKAKIHLLRTWLDSSTPSTALSTYHISKEDDILPKPEICFHFNSQTQDRADDPVVARNTFLWATDPPATRAKRENVQKSDKKVDDIADCFLQAAAYVAWGESLVELKRQAKYFNQDTVETLEEPVSGKKSAEPRKKKEEQKSKDEAQKVKQEDRKKKKELRTKKKDKEKEKEDITEVEGTLRKAKKSVKASGMP